MTPFDPFTATLDVALARPDAYATRGAVWQWGGAQLLLGRREFYERHPLDGMAVCALHDLVAPDWLARAFLRGFYAVTNCRARTWDEAFGPAFPKGTNLASKRRARINRGKAALAFSDILRRDPQRAVDKGLWEEIGKLIGEGATRAEELYREALRMGMALSADAVRRGRVHEPKPAKLGKRAGVRRKR